jgi:hypothetical protein
MAADRADGLMLCLLKPSVSAEPVLFGLSEDKKRPYGCTHHGLIFTTMILSLDTRSSRKVPGMCEQQPKLWRSDC